uniref:Uncharacterized protein n=1 Tax=Plectus sambesii TaxID=2011161 RepID=A0A914XU72_9BILA
MKFCELPACSQPVVISSSCDPCSGAAHLGQLGQCQWTQWSEWGACQGGGICQRNRICGGGGICECSGLSVDTKTCESIEPIEPIEAIDERPILLLNQDLDQNSSSCDWATWGAWSNCDKTCGGGTHQRTRNCIGDTGSGNVTSAACLCTGELAETEPCGAEPCPGSNATKTGEEGVIIPLEGAIINGNG